MKTPDLPEEKPSAPDKRDFITADSLKARLQAGEIIGATDYDESIRAQFWAAIARVRDDLPCVRSTWRTIDEQHVNGIRTRQKMFRICSRQKGLVDSTLAGLIAFVVFCIGLLSGWFG
ncbi:MAG: hypothetical protein AW09_004089 [Candidatus Accumulibacter phosphatis]|jgi:hypothetical protein|uniref:Transmembrane protein n=1 Tax=Candidatus Accumulibacter phosphatis TaxID=327160 RepID=A0A080LRF8_9PROT|nr:MAG: hypothetical protein AW09_004089 [Candidatus Accumulibacter phosphatis]HCZ16998.1 hypothetical protein [Accumulibacter sp.]HRF12126.1 hypothetical protein [Candidatus Accumulibacter phosphatis]